VPFVTRPGSLCSQTAWAQWSTVGTEGRPRVERGTGHLPAVLPAEVIVVVLVGILLLLIGVYFIAQGIVSSAP
jgi:hypothetical protein